MPHRQHVQIQPIVAVAVRAAHHLVDVSFFHPADQHTRVRRVKRQAEATRLRGALDSSLQRRKPLVQQLPRGGKTAAIASRGRFASCTHSRRNVSLQRTHSVAGQCAHRFCGTWTRPLRAPSALEGSDGRAVARARPPRSSGAGGRVRAAQRRRPLAGARALSRAARTSGPLPGGSVVRVALAPGTQHASASLERAQAACARTRRLTLAAAGCTRSRRAVVYRCRLTRKGASGGQRVHALRQQGPHRGIISRR
jgi:hypothetical protein